MESRKVTTCVTAVSLLALLGGFAFAQQEPTAAEAQRELLQFTVPDSIDTNVPTSVQHAISKFRTALAFQTDAIVTRLPADASAISAKQHLSAGMPSPKVGRISDAQWKKIEEQKPQLPIAGLYDRELTLSVSQPKPGFLLIQESFGIPCGNYTVLLAYGNASGVWKRILLWESKPYDEISGAFGDTFETLLLKPAHNKNPLLLVLHGTPWCTSTSSAFDMDVFELGDSAMDKPMWHGVHGYRRFDLDPPLKIRQTADGFEVRTHVDTNGENISRTGVMRYSIRADGVHRVEPLAMNGRDSIEEWLRMPRKEAAEFADAPAESLTWKMFQDFTYEGKDKDATVPFPNFGAVRACKDSKTHFQAEVTSEIFDHSAKGSLPGPSYFVQLEEVPNGYRIHEVTQKAVSSCNGPDIMAGS